MPFKFGTRSMLRLRGVKEPLRKVAIHAIELSSVDFTVLEGVRTPERQAQLYAQGRTSPGKIVTWTMRSKHIDGLAVDLAPVNADGSIDWNDPKKFDQMAEAVFAAAKELGVEIRWGADWDRDGNKREKGEHDSPHFELVD